MKSWKRQRLPEIILGGQNRLHFSTALDIEALWSGRVDNNYEKYLHSCDFSPSILFALF